MNTENEAESSTALATHEPDFQVMQDELFTEYVEPIEGGLGVKISKSISFETWGAAVHGYYGAMKIASFALGDLLNFGEKKFHEEFAQALDARKISLKTVENVMYVCENVPATLRRAELTFSHHAEVAALGDPAKQKELLEAAVTGNLNIKALRKLRNEKYPSKKVKSRQRDKASAPAGFDEQEKAGLKQIDTAIAFLEGNWDNKKLDGAEWLKRVNTLRSYMRKLKLIK
jgi:hypothetical protein